MSTELRLNMSPEETEKAVADVQRRIGDTLSDGQRQFEASALFQPITHVEEDSTMSEIQITPELLAQATELATKLKVQQGNVVLDETPEAPKLPLAVTLAVGLANALNATEAKAKAAKDATKASWSLFKAAYRARRPAEVKVVKATDVSPEELAAAMEILKAQQNAQ